MSNGYFSGDRVQTRQRRRQRGTGARLALLALLLAAAGCWNGENVAVMLCDVSLGQQLIDLQRALDEGAIDEAQHARAQEALLSLTSACQDDESP